MTDKVRVAETPSRLRLDAIISSKALRLVNVKYNRLYYIFLDFILHLLFLKKKIEQKQPETHGNNWIW